MGERTTALIRQTPGERNFHIFYQFLESKLSKDERSRYHLGEQIMGLDDFALVNRRGTYLPMIDGIWSVIFDMHTEMLHAMRVMGFMTRLYKIYYV
jgi:myosin heavy subunit